MQDEPKEDDDDDDDDVPDGGKRHRCQMALNTQTFFFFCSAALQSRIQAGKEGLAGEREEKQVCFVFELNSLDCFLTAKSTGSLSN